MIILPALLAAAAVLGPAFSSPIVTRDNALGGHQNTSLLRPETYQFLDDLLGTLDIPGAVIAVVSDKGSELLTLGVQDKNGTPVAEDTYWAIASNSKFVASLVLGILEQNDTILQNGERFTFDTKITDIIPGWTAFDNETTAEATVTDFFVHRTGIPAYAAAVGQNTTAKDWSDYLAVLKPSAPFRELFQYSNVNYAFLGYIVEVLTGRSFFDVCQELLFDPLNLTATWAALEAAERGARSQGFFRNGLNYTQCYLDAATALNTTLTGNSTSTNSSSAYDIPSYPPSCLGKQAAFDFWTRGTGQGWGAGGSAIFRGTDLLKWATEIVKPAVIPPQVIATAQTGIEATSDTPPNNPEFTTGYYAHGAVSQTYRGYNISLHDGALPGSNSLFTRVPNETVAVFVIANDDVNSQTFNPVVVNTIIDDLLGLEPINWYLRYVGGSSESAPSTDSQGEGDQGISAAPAVPTPPADPLPPPDGYLGNTYAGPAHGQFTLQPLDWSNSSQIEQAGFPLEYFTVDLATQLPGLSLASPVYYGFWDQAIASHIVFTHWDGPLFNWTAIVSYERAPGEVEIQQIPVNGSQYTAKFYGFGTAVFADGGIGMFGILWGTTGAKPEPVVEGVRNASEVFFEKV